jgi:hypothetical protein
MFYTTVVTVRRNRPGDIVPAGVTEVRVTRQVQAHSWGAAVDQSLETLLDDLQPVLGGLSGCQIMSVETDRPQPDRRALR